ncbi:hypothetical protein KY362_00315 [Candidatus Woesearchaeota archaeon]|nr:hypothetical protein [Candidatus Woesearchaeota archaeon]
MGVEAKLGGVVKECGSDISPLAPYRHATAFRLENKPALPKIEDLLFIVDGAVPLRAGDYVEFTTDTRRVNSGVMYFDKEFGISPNHVKLVQQIDVYDSQGGVLLHRHPYMKAGRMLDALYDSDDDCC